MTEPITVEWLHDVKPLAWKAGRRGIEYANWSINSVRCRPANIPPDSYDEYNLGPFVWTVAVTHGANLQLLSHPAREFFSILVMESRDDVIRLLQLLAREPDQQPRGTHAD